MGEREFKIGELKFKLSKIDALKQFHIVRRIAPLLTDFLPVMSSIAKTKMDSLTEEQKLEEFAKVASPIMNGLAKLSDEDANFVLFRLLASVEVEQNFGQTSWTYIATEAGIKIQNLELPVLMQLAGRALMYNLAGFFASLPRKA